MFFLDFCGWVIVTYLAVGMYFSLLQIFFRMELFVLYLFYPYFTYFKELPFSILNFLNFFGRDGTLTH